jgi:hypothetical protein
MEWGLRSDLEWVVAVANSPDVTYDFGFPLMPFERDELLRRPQRDRDVADAIGAYGPDHPDEWAGLWVDQSRGGVVVAQFTQNLPAHEASIRRLLRPDATFEIRQVRWSLQQLSETAARIGEGQARFSTIPAVLVGWGADIRANRVSLDISSTRTDATAQIARLFDVEAEMLDVNSDGTGIGLLPGGELVVIARDAAGEPVRGLWLSLKHDTPGLGAHDVCSTDREGICRVPVEAVTFEVVLERPVSGGRRIVGQATVSVSPGGTAREIVTVSLD